VVPGLHWLSPNQKNIFARPDEILELFSGVICFELLLPKNTNIACHNSTHPKSMVEKEVFFVAGGDCLCARGLVEQWLFCWQSGDMYIYLNRFVFSRTMVFFCLFM